MANDRDDYEIGKGRPPKHTQWKRGQSGNPSGAKKRRTLIDELTEILDEELETVVDGEATVMTGRRVVARKLFVMAAKGDMRAVTLVLANDNAKAEEGEAEVLREQDGLIERFAQRYLRRKKLEHGGSHD
jgi:hypothetical protein